MLAQLSRSFAVLSFLYFSFTSAQNDPLKNFCRLFGHQTAVIDRRLYTDGGLATFTSGSNPLNYTSRWLRYADLDVDNGGMPQEYVNLTKGPAVPSLHGGILWPDTVNKYFYLYGGEYYQSNPESFAMWQYDVINDNWTSLSTPSIIMRASYGAGVVVDDIAKGYYYGGYLSNQSVPGWGGAPLALGNMLEYDIVANKWRNDSYPPGAIPRAEGVMLYLPVGDGGMLVYFGGIQYPYGNSTWIGMPMNQTLIYDIANAKWYSQHATGNVPMMRRKFCAGVSWPDDGSSYNIYLYGGLSMDDPNNPAFDDVWILSIPSFRWINYYTPGPYGHHSLSCNVVQKSQMLIRGGYFPNTTDCDAAAVYGYHNLDLGKQNPSHSQWALFRPNITSYEVPSEIVDVIGGSATGGATVKAPENGWEDRDLSVVFARSYTVATTRTATRSIPATSTPTPANSTMPAPGQKGKSHKGAIIGGAVGGGIVVLLCFGAFIWCILRAHKMRKNKPSTPPPDAKPVELPTPVTNTPMSQSPNPAVPTLSAASAMPPGSGRSANDWIMQGPPPLPVGSHVPTYPDTLGYTGQMTYTPTSTAAPVYPGSPPGQSQPYSPPPNTPGFYGVDQIHSPSTPSQQPWPQEKPPQFVIPSPERPHPSVSLPSPQNGGPVGTTPEMPDVRDPSGTYGQGQPQAQFHVEPLHPRHSPQHP